MMEGIIHVKRLKLDDPRVTGDNGRAFEQVCEPRSFFAIFFASQDEKKRPVNRSPPLPTVASCGFVVDTASRGIYAHPRLANQRQRILDVTSIFES